MALSPFIYGELLSRDIFDQVSQYMYEDVKAYKMYGYVTAEVDGQRVTLQMQSAGAVYYWLDRLWVFDGFIEVPYGTWKLYNFYYFAVDERKRPIYGTTIALEEPVALGPGYYEFRIEYRFVADDKFGLDVPCMTKQNYEYVEYLCPV